MRMFERAVSVSSARHLAHPIVLRHNTPTGRKHTRQTQNNNIGYIGLENTATHLHRVWPRRTHEEDGYLGAQAQRCSLLVNSGLTGLAAVCRWSNIDCNALLPTTKVQAE
jgi:hypothetical protein